MTYKERLKDFETHIDPYRITTASYFEFLGLLCKVYYFIAKPYRDYWLKDTRVLILGNWGSKGLLVGIGWIPGLKQTPKNLARVKKYAKQYCPKMLEETEWSIETADLTC